VSSRLERLLHFVTSHSARDVPKVGIGHTAAGRPGNLNGGNPA